MPTKCCSMDFFFFFFLVVCLCAWCLACYTFFLHSTSSFCFVSFEADEIAFTPTLDHHHHSEHTVQRTQHRGSLKLLRQRKVHQQSNIHPHHNCVVLSPSLLRAASMQQLLNNKHMHAHTQLSLQPYILQCIIAPCINTAIGDLSGAHKKYVAVERNSPKSMRIRWSSGIANLRRMRNKKYTWRHCVRDVCVRAVPWRSQLMYKCLFCIIFHIFYMHNIIRCRKIIFLPFAAPEKKRKELTFQQTFFVPFLIIHSKKQHIAWEKIERKKTATCKEINIFRLAGFIVCVTLVCVIVPSNFLRPLPICVCLWVCRFDIMQFVRNW